MGVRRDTGSVKTIAAQLKSTSPEVAQAAAFALGKIGNQAATTAFREAHAGKFGQRALGSGRGMRVVHERLAAAGNAPTAIEIYDQV